MPGKQRRSIAAWGSNRGKARGRALLERKIKDRTTLQNFTSKTTSLSTGPDNPSRIKQESKARKISKLHKERRYHFTSNQPFPHPNTTTPHSLQPITKAYNSLLPFPLCNPKSQPLSYIQYANTLLSLSHTQNNGQLDRSITKIAMLLYTYNTFSSALLLSDHSHAHAPDPVQVGGLLVDLGEDTV